MSQFAKTFLSLTAFFIVAFLFLGFFLPKEDKIVVSKKIKCSPSHTYSMINDLKKWEKWNPWDEYDPNMKKVFGDVTTGKGAWYSWEGNSKVGKGKLSIENTIENQQVDMLLSITDFSTNQCGFIITPAENGSNVDWYMNMTYSENSISKNILGGYSYLMMKYFLNIDFNKGLENLNNTCN